MQLLHTAGQQQQRSKGPAERNPFGMCQRALFGAMFAEPMLSYVMGDCLKIDVLLLELGRIGAG